MNEGVYIALTIIGALYLIGWPIRISFIRRNVAKIGALPVLVPGFGGAVLIFADIMVLMRYRIQWAYFPLFVHVFLFLYKIPYRKKKTGRIRDFGRTGQSRGIEESGRLFEIDALFCYLLSVHFQLEIIYPRWNLFLRTPDGVDVTC